MTLRLLLSTLFALVALVAADAGAASPSTPLRVTFVGDSVAASLDYVPAARKALARGFDLRLDLRTCRRLVQPSCVYDGAAPATALETVRSLGSTLGSVLVIKVGYNEGPNGYGTGIDRVMRAALADGARGVVWVTLREANPLYHGTNVAIRRAAKRWPDLVVADWNAASAGKSWFGSDGLHLTATGATRLALFLRPYIRLAAAR